MHSGPLTALLDANVLYPFLLRDLLLSLAQEYLYRPKWSEDIEKEWSRNLANNRPDIKPELISHIISEMNRSFIAAKVTGYKELEDTLTLPDIKDRHVLAAAIVSHSDVIVTFNLKDFDKTELSKYDIEPVHPDNFVLNLIDLDPEKTMNAMNKMVKRRKNPSVKREELIDRIGNNNLLESAKRLREITNQ